MPLNLWVWVDGKRQITVNKCLKSLKVNLYLLLVMLRLDNYDNDNDRHFCPWSLAYKDYRRQGLALQAFKLWPNMHGLWTGLTNENIENDRTLLLLIVLYYFPLYMATFRLITYTNGGLKFTSGRNFFVFSIFDL